MGMVIILSMFISMIRIAVIATVLLACLRFMYDNLTNWFKLFFISFISNLPYFGFIVFTLSDMNKGSVLYFEILSYVLSLCLAAYLIVKISQMNLFEALLIGALSFLVGFGLEKLVYFLLFSSSAPL